MKIKNIIIQFYLLIGVLSICFAQEKYIFEASSATYRNLENPNVLNDSSYPDFYDDMMVEVDFPIYYQGKKVYAVLVKNIGVIVLGNMEERIELFPVQLKLKGDSKISYQIDGEPNCGNRILKVEYQNMGFRCDASDSYFANAQLWIHENTGVFEIHFGESLDNPENYSDTENSCYGSFSYGSRLRLQANLSAMPYNDPDQPDFFQGNLASTNILGIGAFPSAGIVYHFDPEIFTDDKLKLSPNPARYFTTVSRPLSCGDFLIKVFDSKGQLVFQEEFTGAITQLIDTANLIPGIYFVQIWNEDDRESFVEKLLIL